MVCLLEKHLRGGYLALQAASDPVSNPGFPGHDNDPIPVGRVNRETRLSPSLVHYHYACS